MKCWDPRGHQLIIIWHIHTYTVYTYVIYTEIWFIILEKRTMRIEENEREKETVSCPRWWVYLPLTPSHTPVAYFCLCVVPAAPWLCLFCFKLDFIASRCCWFTLDCDFGKKDCVLSSYAVATRLFFNFFIEAVKQRVTLVRDEVVSQFVPVYECYLFICFKSSWQLWSGRLFLVGYLLFCRGGMSVGL